MHVLELFEEINICLESYVTKVNQIMKRALFRVHNYLSKGFVTSYYEAVIHVECQDLTLGETHLKR